MGFFDWLFGEDDEDVAPATVTAVSKNEIPEYITGPHQRIINSAEQLIGQPYNPYPGQRVANFSGEQLEAFDRASSLYGTGASRAADAYNMGIGSGSPLSGSEIAGYMNPYIAAVGQQTERELSRKHAQDLIGINANAEQQGAFGGARHGIVEAESNRNFDRNIADMYERVFATGYDQARDTALKFRDTQRQAGLASGQLAAQGQTLGLQDVTTQLGIGALQQEQAQKNYDTAYEDFSRQEQYPYEQLKFGTGILSGAPYSTTSSSTQTSPGTPSSGFFQQAVGLGLAGLGTAANLGWRPLAKEF